MQAFDSGEHPVSYPQLIDIGAETKTGEYCESNIRKRSAFPVVDPADGNSNIVGGRLSVGDRLLERIKTESRN